MHGIAIHFRANGVGNDSMGCARRSRFDDDPDCTGGSASTHSAPTPCGSAVGDSAIRQFALERGLMLVRKADSGPLCTWAAGDVSSRKGLRILANRPIERDGRVQISIILTCRHPPAGFSQGWVYELGVVEGEWKVTRTLDRSIS